MLRFWNTSRVTTQSSYLKSEDVEMLRYWNTSRVTTQLSYHKSEDVEMLRCWNTSRVTTQLSYHKSEARLQVEIKYSKKLCKRCPKRNLSVTGQ